MQAYPDPNSTPPGSGDQPVADHRPPGSNPSVGETLPATRATWSGVGVTFGGQVLLNDFTYTVPDGGIIGVVGPSGPALTAALLTLSGRYRHVTGTVDIAGAPESVVVASLAGEDDYDPLLTVSETVSETANSTPHGSAQANANWSIAGAGLSDLMNRRVGELTTSQRLRMSLAAAAATGANVIVLDVGPVAGEADSPELWFLLGQLATSGRLLIVGAGTRHPAMNLVIYIPQGPESP